MSGLYTDVGVRFFSYFGWIWAAFAPTIRERYRERSRSPLVGTRAEGASGAFLVLELLTIGGERSATTAI